MLAEKLKGKHDEVNKLIFFQPFVTKAAEYLFLLTFRTPGLTWPNHQTLGFFSNSKHLFDQFSHRQFHKNTYKRRL